MDSGRRPKTPALETKEFITHSTASHMRVSMMCWFPLFQFLCGWRREPDGRCTHSGFICSQMRERSIMPRNGQEESWIFKRGLYNPNSFPLGRCLEVSQKMNPFLRIVANHWPNCLIKYVDQEMVREKGVRNSLELIFKKDFTVANTRCLKRVGNVECPSNTLIIGPFGTSFCERRHAIFEL